MCFSKIRKAFKTWQTDRKRERKRSLTLYLSLAKRIDARWNLQSGFLGSIPIALFRVSKAASDFFKACWTFTTIETFGLSCSTWCYTQTETPKGAAVLNGKGPLVKGFTDSIALIWIKSNHRTCWTCTRNSQTITEIWWRLLDEGWNVIKKESPVAKIHLLEPPWPGWQNLQACLACFELFNLLGNKHTQPNIIDQLL